MNFRIKLTLAALAAFILMSSAVSFAAPVMASKDFKLTTDSDTPWPPAGNPDDPSDPNNNDDSGSSSGSGSDSGSGSGSDNSNPDNPYDPDNAPMPN